MEATVAGWGLHTRTRNRTRPASAWRRSGDDCLCPPRGRAEEEEEEKVQQEEGPRPYQQEPCYYYYYYSSLRRQ